MKSKIRHIITLILTAANSFAGSSPDCYIYPYTDNWQIVMQQTSDINASDAFAPLAGDLDGDGIPEIVTIAHEDDNNATLLVFFGNDISKSTSISIGDAVEPNIGTPCGIVRLVNPDDAADTVGCIFVITATGYLYSFKYKGYGELSLFRDFTIPIPDGTFGFADFDGNGSVECFVGALVFDAWTLQLIGNGSSSYCGASYTKNTLIRISAAADVLPDADGTELICGNRIYSISESGISEVKTIDPPTGISADGQTLIADFDGDNLPDVLVKSRMVRYAIYAYNPRTGEILFSQMVDTRTNRYFNFPSIGDINGDGSPDIICSSRQKIRAFSYDKETASLSELFSMAHADNYGSSGVTLFDFNDDEIQEIVYHDSDSLMVLTVGDTSAICLAGYPLYSEPLASIPVIADCDGDGMVDILLAGALSEEANSTLNSFSVFLPNYEQTARPVRKIWNQYAYYATNVSDNMTIPSTWSNPATYIPNGETFYNAFQQQIFYENEAITLTGDFPDLTFAGEPELSYTDGTENYTMQMQVTNIGDEIFDDILNIAVYNYNQRNTSHIYTASLEAYIVPGDTVVFEFTIPITTNYPRYTVVLNDRGQKYGNYICHAETDFSNNSAEFSKKMFEVPLEINVLTPYTKICAGEITKLAVEQQEGFSYKWYDSETDTSAYDNKTYLIEDSIYYIFSEDDINNYELPADSGAAQSLTLFEYRDKTFWVEPRRNDTLFSRVPVILYYDRENCTCNGDTSIAPGKTIWKHDFGGNSPDDNFAELVNEKFWLRWINETSDDWYTMCTSTSYQNGLEYKVKDNDAGLFFGSYGSWGKFRSYDAINSPNYFTFEATLSFRKKVGQGGNLRYLREREIVTYSCDIYLDFIFQLTQSWKDAIVCPGYIGSPDTKDAVYLNFSDHTYPNDPERGYFQMQYLLTSISFYKKAPVCNKMRYTLAIWGSRITGSSVSSRFTLKVIDDNTGSIINSTQTDKIMSDDPVWKCYTLPFSIEQTSIDSIMVRIDHNSSGSGVVALDDIEILYYGTSLPYISDAPYKTACENSSCDIIGKFEKDSCFLADTIAFQWQFTQDTASEWGIVKQGTFTGFAADNPFVDTLQIDTCSIASAGWYRLITGTPEDIDCELCRFVSDTLYLTVNLPDSLNMDTIYCKGTEMVFDDVPVDASGEYPEHLQKQLTGCDSVITWDVTAYPSYRITTDTIICNDVEFKINDSLITVSGTYTEHAYCEYSGCDSIITWQVFMQPASMNISGTTGICDNVTATYSYEDKGLDTSVYYTWSITEEAQTFDYDDSIQVIWNTYGNKNVVLQVHNTDCMDSAIYPVTIHKSPVAAFYARPEDSLTNDDFHMQVPVVFDNQSYLYSTSEIDNLDMSYDWDFGNGLTDDNFEPEPEYEELGTYTIQLIATDPTWGCSDTCSKTIEVVNFDEAAAEIPTAFTPNGDGHNDVLLIRGWRVTELNYFKIYNRWGQVVFETTELSAGWDGTFKGSPQPIDTYTYRFEIYDDNGNSIVKKGCFDLIR